MGPTRVRLAILVLGAVALTAHAIDAREPGENARCVAGNCVNGTGTVSSAAGEFTGTFAQTPDPFLKRNRATFRAGKFLDRKTGRAYEGEFSYLPINQPGLPSGSYIFQGARIDDEFDEVVRGLFISDPTLPGQPIAFRKARPDYLIKLKQDFDLSVAKAAADQRAIAKAIEDQQRANESMSDVLGVLGGLLAMGANRNVGSLQSSSLSALTGGIAGGQSSREILQGMVTKVLEQSGVDPALASSLGNARNGTDVVRVLTGLDKANIPMTRAEYKQWLENAMTGGASAQRPAGTPPGAGSAGMGSASGGPAAGSPSSGARIFVSSVSLKSGTREQACESSKKRTAADGQKITGECSCNTLFEQHNCRAMVVGEGPPISAAMKEQTLACTNESNYSGPKNNEQTDNFCKLAWSHKCMFKVTGDDRYLKNASQSCRVLDETLKAALGAQGSAARHCSYCN